MKLPLNWLNDYIKIKKDSNEIANLFTYIGHMQDGPIKNNILSLEVRQNRPDCLSILGLAREIAAVLKVTVREPKLCILPQDIFARNYLHIQNEKKLNRFFTLHLKVKVGETPKEIKERLNAYGMPQINNIVDLTNFVMIEQGQPMHAFDAEKVMGKKLIVRNAKQKETFETLLGEKVNLTKEDLVIADKTKALALAGIIGGRNSSVTSTTKEILLEAANYDQVSIRKSSRRHAIRTEASIRLEKYLSPKLPEIAVMRFLHLLKKYEIQHTLLGYEDYSKQIKLNKINFNIDELKRIGGINLEREEIEEILKSLNFKIVNKNGNILNIKVPYYRTDVTLEEDLVEEILRIYGYENIKAHKLNFAPPNEITPKEYLLEEEIRDELVKLGFDEHITEPLVKSSGRREEITFSNPLNKNKDALRTEITQTLKDTLTTYKKHKIPKEKIFEVGKAYRKGDNKAPWSSAKVDKLSETRLVTALVGKSVPFRELKGYLETLLKNLNIKNYEIKPKEAYAEIHKNNLLIGYLKRNEFTLFIEELSKIRKDKIQYIETELKSRIHEDITVKLPQKFYVGKIIDKIKSKSSLIKDVTLVDLYNPTQKEKSITLRITFDTDNPAVVKSLREEISRIL